MPDGMYLRSDSDWHLDALGVNTIEAYLETRGLTPVDVYPISRALYLDYCEWFREQYAIDPVPETVTRLDRGPDGHFRATLANDDSIMAHRVVLAIGYGAFSHVPADLTAILPSGRYSHTCDTVRFEEFAGKCVVIVGGRQSAFEWAALLREAGTTDVHIVHRQDAPAFAEADWSWVSPMVDQGFDDPGWYRRLSLAQQEEIGKRLYAEGRLKVEPWLESRVMRDGIRQWPNTQVVECLETTGSDLAVTLDNGERHRADHIILATGYKVQIDRLPFLAAGNILPALDTRNGFPVLGEHFETSVPGLAITSMPATQDFGPFFGFTIAVRMSARMIVDRFLEARR
jgi:cation diffusion facilitator CzcD-associated flavoprotein CzcO